MNLKGLVIAMTVLIGFDIGGTKCAVSVGEERDGGLNILRKRTIPTDHAVPPRLMLERLCALAWELLAPGEVPVAAGISCGGPLDSRRGVILSPPNLPGWDEVPATAIVSALMRCPVALQNDANACAIAEWKYGAGVGADNLIFLTFGTGLGAGLILGGVPYTGACDMAGEVGHMRLCATGPVGYGKAGSFEGFCSGGGIAQLGRMVATEALQMGGRVSFCAGADALADITARDIAECAARGEADALRVFDLCAEKLGEGLSILIDLLNPECIILGSIFCRCEELLRPRMQQVIDRETLTLSRAACRILPAGLGERLGDCAALSVAATLTRA